MPDTMVISRARTQDTPPGCGPEQPDDTKRIAQHHCDQDEPQGTGHDSLQAAAHRRHPQGAIRDRMKRNYQAAR
jgi:hypothetical protein